AGDSPSTVVVSFASVISTAVLAMTPATLGASFTRPPRPTADPPIRRSADLPTPFYPSRHCSPNREAMHVVSRRPFREAVVGDVLFQPAPRTTRPGFAPVWS